MVQNKFKMINSKKAEGIWISWVLLVLLGVILSVIIYKWSVGLAKSDSEDIAKRLEGSECRKISVRIDSVCQDSQTLYINISNNNDLRVDGMLFRMYNVLEQADIQEKNITIDPGRKETIEVAKQNAINQVEVVPFRKVKNELIFCTEKIAAANVKVCNT